MNGRFGQRRRGQRPPERLRFWPEERRAPLWKRFAPLWLGAALVGTAYGSGLFERPAGSTATEAAGAMAAVGTGSVTRTFGLCHRGGGTNCVVDGDTIWLAGENIRIADIDAPETHEPACAAEQELGDRATRRLHELVNGGAVTLTPIDRDEDGYGRKLRIVNVAGTSVGETLVGEGLARWYEGGRRSWCS